MFRTMLLAAFITLPTIVSPFHGLESNSESGGCSPNSPPASNPDPIPPMTCGAGMVPVGICGSGVSICQPACSSGGMPPVCCPPGKVCPC